jgi:hypothetical protein
MEYTTTQLDRGIIKKKVNKIKKVITGSEPTKNNSEGHRNTPQQTHRTTLQ